MSNSIISKYINLNTALLIRAVLIVYPILHFIIYHLSKEDSNILSYGLSSLEILLAIAVLLLFKRKGIPFVAAYLIYAFGNLLDDLYYIPYRIEANDIITITIAGYLFILFGTGYILDRKKASYIAITGLAIIAGFVTRNVSLSQPLHEYFNISYTQIYMIGFSLSELIIARLIYSKATGTTEIVARTILGFAFIQLVYEIFFYPDSYGTIQISLKIIMVTWGIVEYLKRLRW